MALDLLTNLKRKKIEWPFDQGNAGSCIDEMMKVVSANDRSID
jgi:hypothetical protein